MTYGSSQPRDLIQASTVTYATDAAMPDPLTWYAAWESNTHLQSDLSCCSLILNPLCHSTAGSPCTMLNRNGEKGHLYLVSDIWGSLQPFTVRWDVSYGLLKDALY